MIENDLTRTVILALCGGLGVAFAEFLRIKRVIGNEFARKIVHALHAVVIVVWAHGFESYIPVIVAEIIFVSIVLLARFSGRMAGLRAVERITYGEVLLPFGVILLCLLNPSYPVFAVCMLQLGLADAMAAIIGTKLTSPTYKVFNHTKSLAGTLAFFATSLIIFSVYVSTLARFDATYVPLIVLVSVILATIENLSPYGSDNITIPLVTYALLTAGVFA